jgi:hypothetical protein
MQKRNAIRKVPRVRFGDQAPEDIRFISIRVDANIGSHEWPIPT